MDQKTAATNSIVGINLIQQVMECGGKYMQKLHNLQELQM